MSTVPVEQSVDSIWSAGDAIDFSADKELLTIDVSVVVGSQNGSGVDQTAAYSGGGVINNGTIFSQGSSYAGVYMRNGADTVTNNTGAFIQGYDGVNFFGLGTEKLVNAGAITGIGVGVNFTGGDVTQIIVNNSGLIYGSTGVLIQTTQLEAGATIKNSGLIETSAGTGNAILIDQGAASKTTIVNQAGAVIKAANYAVYNESGILALTNNGKLVGGIYDSGGAKDIITNNGSITNGAVVLSAHNDTFNGQGSTSSVEVFGNGGKDHLIGGAHGDFLNGGLGDDTLTGGKGSDSFNFTTKLSTTNVDTITDFAPGTDDIRLNPAVFHGITNDSGALTANQFSGNGTETSTTRIVYDPATGHLSYDSNGSGSGHLVQFATLAEHLSLHNTDFALLLSG